MTDKHTQPLDPTVTAGESDLVCFGTTATYALAPIMPDIANLIGRLRDGERLSQRDMDNLREEAAAALEAPQAEVERLTSWDQRIVATMEHEKERADAADAENERLRGLVVVMAVLADSVDAALAKYADDMKPLCPALPGEPAT